jgi:hypothetical protein
VNSSGSGELAILLLLETLDKDCWNSTRSLGSPFVEFELTETRSLFPD